MQALHNKQRIITVDALRGFALLGILLAHMIFWYNAGPLPESVFAKHNNTATTVISIINEILISGKFFAFFSFLFGLSFYLQMSSMEQRSSSFVWRYTWRIVLLGIIGLIHHAFWRGDILSIYAPLGILLIPMRKLGNRAILIIGLLLAINLPGILMQLFDMLRETMAATPPPPPPQQAPAAIDPGQQYYDIATKGNLPALLKDNLQNLGTKFDFQFGSGRIYVTMGFFLLGMYAGRRQWFAADAQTVKPVFKKLRNNSGWLVLGTLVCALGMFALNEIFTLGWQQSRTAGFIFSIFANINSAALVCFYVAGLTLLMNRKSGQQLLYPLAPIGKMALTSYLSQTVLGLVLYFHIGFTLFGQTPPWLNWLIGISFFLFQALVSKWWLRYFNYGPVEWLWRTATYFKAPPMRRTKT
jgi:uncharacterized protein